MKILWIVNIPLGPLCKRLNQKDNSGLWMSPLLEQLAENKEFKMTVAITAYVKETVRMEENGIVYYALPDVPPMLYRENKPSNIRSWEELFAREKPDLIELWGTEFTHGLCALRAAGGIPSIVRMQGYLSAIAAHYTAGMTPRELRRSVTLRDIWKRDSIARQQEKYFSAAQKEAQIIELSNRVICQNGWGESVIKARHPNARVDFCPLSIQPVFGDYQWRIEETEPFSVICNASDYSLKGVHVLIRAIALLKHKYPEIKLYVPGRPAVAQKTLEWQLRKRGYAKYVEKLIRELDVESRIVWLGNITQKELAERYAKTRVFVLCSAIENQSSSLIEAMTVGVPAIASAVGEIPQFIKDRENGLLYRFGEYDVLADRIDKVFSDERLSNRLSENGQKDMRREHDAERIYEIVCGIYRDAADSVPQSERTGG